MGWTSVARAEHNRESLRYPSDLTDREWAPTAPFIPPTKSGGRRRTTDMRKVVNAPVSTIRRYFHAEHDASPKNSQGVGGCSVKL